MAFKQVGNSGITFKKLTELAIGESITGYLLGVDTSTKIEGAQNLRMKIDGQVVSYSVAGNIKYMIKDNALSFGQNTKITRLPDGKIKGKTATKFEVQQDADDKLVGSESLNGANAGTTPKATSAGISDKIKSLKANATVSSSN